MIRILSLLLPLFIFLNCNEPKEIIINGKLSLADPEVIQMAQISIIQNETEILRQQLNEETFTLSLPSDGYYKLIASAPNHDQLETIITPTTGNVSIDIQLDKIKHTILDTPYLVGSFNGFNPQQAMAMDKKGDAFEAKVPVVNGLVKYGLLGASGQKELIAGTQADAYEVFQADMYISVINSTENEVVITFKPNKNEILPTQITSSNSELNDVFEAAKLNLENSNVVKEAVMKRYFTRSENLDIDFESLATPLINGVKSETNETIQKVYLIGLLELSLNGYEIEYEKEVDDLIQSIPSADPFWGFNSYAVLSAMDLVLDTDFKNRYIKTMSEAHASSNVQSVSTYYGFLLADELMNNDERLRYYNKLINEFPESPFVEYAKYQFDPNNKVVNGASVPEFSFNSITDENVYSKSSLSGEYVLLDFWATWCGPCIAEMDELHEVYDDFKEKPFKILSLSFDETVEDVYQFRKERYNMPWYHGFVEGGFDSQIAQTFEITGIPKPILLDPNGKIVATGVQLRGPNLRKTLEKLLSDS